MTYEKKDGGISLFANDKQGNDKRPDYKGKLLLGGVEYEVAIWNKVSSKGTQFLSGTVKQAVEKQEPKKEENNHQFKDDEIPFDISRG